MPIGFIGPPSSPLIIHYHLVVGEKSAGEVEIGCPEFWDRFNGALLV
jgi:hypothetical protein